MGKNTGGDGLVDYLVGVMFLAVILIVGLAVLLAADLSSVRPSGMARAIH
jgi:hypothetical protein